ncbi:MAG TPA: type II 3-dehydroquinate dehydratase [Polyangiaceae bacterium]|nr:type II 3-dehydroquinate dehydratase [Polyangiaceae bacterium]
MAEAKRRAARLKPKVGARKAPERRILVLSGPNLDRLGRREPAIYGATTLAEVHRTLKSGARERGASVDCRQSNHEGVLIDWIGAAGDDGFSGLLFNPGAFTHTSYALYDAVRGSGLPTIELHLSNPAAREAFRHRSTIAPACVGTIAGFGAASYTLALAAMLDHLENTALVGPPAGR